MAPEGRQVERVNVWSINISQHLTSSRLGPITVDGAPQEDVVGSSETSEERGPPHEVELVFQPKLYLYNYNFLNSIYKCLPSFVIDS